ncbi:IS30 family transposase [uncultured Mitsuokella sp.]|uniref:IS30 family transposase n=1 Tax=uncultured Mitsuokella sp. TaxID=453120 RepID=UPI002626731C|nr:IS30 family transposase [uncultured Mitsuokella sp.]
MTERDRYKIEAYFQAGVKPQEIAEHIGCSKRTIERERRLGMAPQLKPATKAIKACGDIQVQCVYLADVAQRRHEENAARKGRGLKIDKDHGLARHIEHKIKTEKWSPAAIIGELCQRGWRYDARICVKTLHNYIDQQLFLEITNEDLPYKKNQGGRPAKSRRTVAWNNRDGKSIDERPDEINHRKEFGHWEIGLVVGRKGTRPVILTLVERQTRKSLYVLAKNKSQKEVLQALRRLQRRVKGDFTQVFKSITADNGSEFLDGEGMKRAAKCGEVYYAHPYSSWERGSNENGNRMLRRFLPKGTDISKLKPKELQRIEDWANNYPRRIFGYKSANDMYAAMI